MGSRVYHMSMYRVTAFSYYDTTLNKLFYKRYILKNFNRHIPPSPSTAELFQDLTNQSHSHSHSFTLDIALKWLNRKREPIFNEIKTLIELKSKKFNSIGLLFNPMIEITS
ncbi:hypothetical protein BpHYR1_048327 [Brachionus plicatilis]|uniref:Uncharacterized protein n=1 Tax=Brachionus plicatilis TaxID=10195 RepID=A0A3M7PE51_BRAPC|nr:hypothetical protein BpHYR1_048327 [Brachionus plicatilis]